MAKRKISTAFKNATITVEDGEYIITEYTKDDSQSFNLSELLNELIDVDGLNLSYDIGNSLEETAGE